MEPIRFSHHVLIADDSRPSREELCSTLAEIGTLKVSQVENGAEAISFVEQARPDLVLCDQTMPVLDGLQVLKLLRRRWSAVELPILMLTGSQSVSDKVLAFRFGANDYVTKPAHRQELLARVQAQLALKTAIAQNLAARDRLLQASKLQTVGRLAAGLAHEINTPAQYVSDNLHFLQRAVTHLHAVLAPIREWAAGDSALGSHAAEQLRDGWRRQRLDFLLKEAPAAAAQGLHGIQRISELITELQAFTGAVSGQDRVAGNVNDAIKSAVGASRGVWQHTAHVDLDLAAELPLVACQMAELSQVFLHLVYNSVEAFRGDFGTAGRGSRISVSSRAEASGVEILFADDGPGIDAAIQSEIFDPFFTTKPVGKGTGQGLAIGYDVLVSRHDGRLSFEPSPSGGAAFRIWLPGAALV